MITHASLFSDKLRPKSISDFLLPTRLERLLEGLMEGRRLMNLTFTGRPGVGKTSAARMISKNYNTYVMNGSRKEDNIIEAVRSFGSSASLDGRLKMCLIDEADAMTARVQDALRFEIESFSDNCRFLLTANDVGRLSGAIQSRCMPVSFNLTRAEFDEIRVRALPFYEARLEEIGLKYDLGTLRVIVHEYLPDYRMIANHIEREFGD